MAVKEQDRKAETRVSTGRATAGVPQRMQKREVLDEAATPPPTLAELQERQNRKRPKRRPTRSYDGAEPEEADEESVPDVPPTTCD